MAKRIKNNYQSYEELKRLYTKDRKRKTSIGKSKNSRPTNKQKKRNWKKYRGQGK
jgi:hypothetical protein